MAVAAFTYSMRKTNIISQVSEKNKTHTELEAFIEGQTEAKEMGKKVQTMGKGENKTTATVKTEPVAYITRKRKFNKSGKNKTFSDRNCGRCGEGQFDGHNNDCKANGKTCNESKKWDI